MIAFCNVMTIWPYCIISLVIISINIPLSPFNALTYHHFSDGSLFWYTKSHLSIVGNRLSYISLLKSVYATIWFVGKRSLYYPTAVLIPTPQYPVCWDSTFFIQIRWDLDHFTKSCNWQKPTDQNQPRMDLKLGERDSSLKHRCQALGNFRDKAQDAWHARRSKTRLLGICSTLLREKLVAPILL